MNHEFGDHSVYKINEALNNYEKVAIIDSLVEHFTYSHITNDGSIFRSTSNDLYYFRLLPLSNQASSIPSENKIVL